MLCMVRLKPTYLLRREIQPYSMVVSHGMSICPTAPTSSLKVLAANQTGIYVDIAQTLRAQLFEIKVERLPRYLHVISRVHSPATSQQSTHSVEIHVSPREVFLFRCSIDILWVILLVGALINSGSQHVWRSWRRSRGRRWMTRLSVDMAICDTARCAR